MKPELSLWLALDAIVQLANSPTAWTGNEVSLIDEICRITNTRLSQGRRAWLVEQLDTEEVQDILARRGVTFLFGDHDSRLSVGPGVSIGPDFPVGGKHK